MSVFLNTKPSISANPFTFTLDNKVALTPGLSSRTLSQSIGLVLSLVANTKLHI